MKSRIPSIDPARQETARTIVRELARLYPEARCSLTFANPLQLLVATILSAQCTDTCVNKITPALFARFPNAYAFAAAKPADLERLIKATGFFRTKAKNIIACCQAIVEQHGGEVPRCIDDLVTLAGVGRKTANVLLGNAYGIPGIAVDTHVARLARRLGLTARKTPTSIERELTALVDGKDLSLFGLHLIYHGRNVCRARKPLCEQCSLATVCPKLGVSKPKAKAEEGPVSDASQKRSSVSDASQKRSSLPMP